MLANAPMEKPSLVQKYEPPRTSLSNGMAKSNFGVNIVQNGPSIDSARCRIDGKSILHVSAYAELNALKKDIRCRDLSIGCQNRFSNFDPIFWDSISVISGIVVV